MKVFLFFFSVSALFYNGLAGQSCLPGSTLFASQQEIDDFTTDYSGCTRITGNIIIQGGDIVNLDGFIGITSIIGNVTLANNPLLPLLNGFSNLDSVGGNFFIQHNDGLLNLQDLSSLNYVGGTLDVSSNENLNCFSGMGSLDYIGNSLLVRNNLSLTCFAGLTHLDSINGGLIIENNQSMTDLSGLSSLNRVGGIFKVSNNLSLTNFNGLNELSYIGGNLDVFNNQSLISFNGFSNLLSIEGSLIINRNELLNSLVGLQSLTTVNGDLSVTNNENLPNLCGLESIDFVGLNNIEIIENQVLSVCHIQNICDYLSIPSNTANIQNNDVGCNDVQQIISECGNPFDCTMLPVQLMEFRGLYSDKGNLLEWVTSSEINNDFFEIERSADGYSFTALGKVKGAGNSSQLNYYKWTDKTSENNVSYYRLKQVDYDGQFSYSDIIKIVHFNQISPIKLNPNPASDFLFLSTDNRLQSIKIYDTFGILQDSFNEVPEFIDLSDFKNGIYFMDLGGLMTKFIVQH